MEPSGRSIGSTSARPPDKTGPGACGLQPAWPSQGLASYSRSYTKRESASRMETANAAGGMTKIFERAGAWPDPLPPAEYAFSYRPHGNVFPDWPEKNPH